MLFLFCYHFHTISIPVRSNILSNMYATHLLFVLVFFGARADPRGSRVRRIVGGSPAAIPPEDDPVVFVKHNGKFATVLGVKDPREYHYYFKGVRFAYAPTGKRRFARPRAYVLEGDVNATQYPPPCLQPFPRTGEIIGDEDCLFLNVFTPDLPDGTEGLPVVIWIHGGGFRYGSASQYGVQNLVNKKVVLVTIQYRLGTLGFLSTGTKDVPGNVGLFDMVLAVKWVRNYIGFFGGNPYRITVMGHGTGASSAMLMSLTRVAKGLSHSIIAMSGTATSHWAVDNEPRNMAKEIADHQGCPTSSEVTMISCLRAVSAEDIITGDTELERKHLRNRGYISGMAGLLTPAPTIDGRNDDRSLPGFLESKPIEALEKDDIPKISLLTGVTRDETAHAINDQFHTEVIDKLGSIPNYLNSVLLGKLQNCVPFKKESTKNMSWSVLDAIEFTNYFNVPKNRLSDAVKKISEATADALFNLPAFVTADLWSKRVGSAYLYSFEHVGRAVKGNRFLQGNYLVSNEDRNDTVVGHGDELAYLFTPQHLNGSSMFVEVNETADDQKVRELFTDLIYNFVKFGKINVDNENPQFDESNNYVQITTDVKLLKNFRYCEMGLWAGLTERLQTSFCSLLSVFGKNFGAVENVFNIPGQKISETASKILDNKSEKPKDKTKLGINLFG